MKESNTEETTNNNNPVRRCKSAPTEPQNEQKQILMNILQISSYPRRSRSAIGVDIVFTLDVCMSVCLYVCMYVSALERKRLIGMT